MATYRHVAGEARPQTHASLQPPVAEHALRSALANLDRPIPEQLCALYALAGGQSAERSGAARGIFRGYWFLQPNGSIDSLRGTWSQFSRMASSGVSWARPTLAPFAKDFGGNYVALDSRIPDAPAVVEIEEGAEQVLDDSLVDFLASVASDLENGRTELVEPVTPHESGVAQIDLNVDRTVGDPVQHPAFAAIGLEVVVGDLAATYRHLTQTVEQQARRILPDLPPQLHGLALEIKTPGARWTEAIAQDRAGARLPIRAGIASGGNRPPVAYCWSTTELPDGATLAVQARIKP